ncbi:sensor histidine kinase [Psychrobium sp. nBUS_13]|uniref:sensor histidine kinase n=1 Tax=Psychrobium sp. nBUS_13 TaxID=3395319 RepID=UPI003EBAD69F
MNKKMMRQWWNTYYSVSFTSTKNYKVVTFIGYLISFFISIYTYQKVFLLENQYSFIIIRTLADIAWLFVITHFFIRSFIKIFVLNNALSKRVITNFLIFLFVVSCISLAGSFAIEKLAIFEMIDPINSKVDLSKVDISKIEFSIWVVINTYVTLIGWAIVYLFWHQQINRKKVQKEMHHAQIQQLTNQLNPHFLFNAFNSIRALIYEDQDKAADTVTQLSELFRTHLHAHLKATSSMDDEWQVCSRYLTIEEIRLEERLQLGVTIDDDLLTQKIPTLTLLTLVENAIKHGISPNSEPGKIMISATKIDNKRWQLMVGNSINKPSQADGTNTGMKNVKQRLALMFGNKYDWHQTKTDSYFEVKMELPLA